MYIKFTTIKKILGRALDLLLKSDLFFLAMAKLFNSIPFSRFYLQRFIKGSIYRLSSSGHVMLARRRAGQFSSLNIDCDTLYFLAPIFHLQNDFQKSFELLEKAEEIRCKSAKASGVSHLNLRVFSKSFAPIGHIAIIDTFIKAQALGIIEKKNNIILNELKFFSNPSLVKYWEKYFQLVTNPLTVKKFSEYLYPTEELLSLIQCADGRLLSLDEFGMETELEWEKRKFDCLLTLSSKHKIAGYSALHKLGLPEGAWFCGLHVRDTVDPLRDARNADISTYDLAINAINKKGGWVIRMGDPSMKPFPHNHLNFIDYAHCDQRSDWMDVFLWAEGRFLLGTGSGPGNVPRCFGRPVALSNCAPIGHREWGKDYLYLPKLYIHKDNGNPLTLEERLSESYAFQESKKSLQLSNIQVIDNTPKQIEELAIEIMEKINGTNNYTELQLRQKQSFMNLSIKNRVYPSDIACAYIDRYKVV